MSTPPSAAPVSSPLSAARREALLVRAWELERARAYPEVVALLAPLGPEALLAEPELGASLADAWLNVGELERGVELARLLEEPCRRQGNTRLFRRRLNLEGLLLFQQGRVEAAERAWLEMLDASARCHDERGEAAATLNLATVASIRCEWPRAVLLSQRAIAAFQRLGNARNLGAAHLNLALTLREMGRRHEAGQHLEHGMELLRAHGTEAELAKAEMQRALLFLDRGDARLAGAAAARALERLDRAGMRLAGADAEHVAGSVALAEGRREEARRRFARALERLAAGHDLLSEAQTYEELAVLERQEGNAAASREAREAAERIYREMSAPGRAERLRGRLGG